MGKRRRKDPIVHWPLCVRWNLCRPRAGEVETPTIAPCDAPLVTCPTCRYLLERAGLLPRQAPGART